MISVDSKIRKKPLLLFRNHKKKHTVKKSTVNYTVNRIQSNSIAPTSFPLLRNTDPHYLSRHSISGSVLIYYSFFYSPTTRSTRIDDALSKRVHASASCFVRAFPASSACELAASFNCPWSYSAAELHDSDDARRDSRGSICPRISPFTFLSRHMKAMHMTSCTTFCAEEEAKKKTS